jgi:hypothetical protein
MRRLATMLGAGAVAILLSSGAWATEAAVTPAQIEAAKTPADHQAIAAAFDREAARLESLAKEHDAMAKAYDAPSQKGSGKAAMAAHCAKLSKKYSEAAAENRELAKAHRAMGQ